MRTFAAASLIVLIFRAGFLSGQTGSSTPPAAFVEVDGSRLYYEECGTGQKAVLLLHDGVVNSAVWDDVWPTFCKQFHAIRYDRRGYGRSPATKKPYYEADDVAALLLDRKVSQAVLVASSHGGNIALRFALRYPAQVSGLVLVGPEAEGFPPARTQSPARRPNFPHPPTAEFPRRSYRFRDRARAGIDGAGRRGLRARRRHNTIRRLSRPPTISRRRCTSPAPSDRTGA